MTKFSQIDLRFLFLALMLVFLPGVEALKNIFAFLFFLSWVLISYKRNNWGGKWLVIDTIFLLWILADFLISINAVMAHKLDGGGFSDILRFVIIAWVLSRINFSKEKCYQLGLIAVMATLVTLAFSYYSTGGVLKELHSVGHINHTAIFLTIAYSISISILLFNYKKLNNYHKLILFASSLILFLSTIDTGSRASFGLLIIVTLSNALFLIYKVRRLSISLLIIGFISFVGITLIQSPPDALKRILATEHILEDSVRTKIRNFSYYAFKKNPILGNGFGNYSSIKLDDIKSTVIDDIGVFNSELYITSSHPHNVYYKYLVAGGLLIFSIFLWFWFYVAWIIIKIKTTDETFWIISSSISVILINLGIGWVNTTLHHEHAILSMFVLGILISLYRKTLQSDMK